MDEITSWLYLSQVDHWAVREWVNGLWFAISFAMCVEFGIRLYDRMVLCGMKFREDLGTRAILALFGYFLGESIMRGWIWLLLAFQNMGNPNMGLQNAFYIAFVAAALSTWAAFCCLYVFSSNHWSWVRAAFIVSCFVAASTIFQILY